jgi:hypothetical protein
VGFPPRYGACAALIAAIALVPTAPDVALAQARFGDFVLVPGVDAMSDRDLTYLSTAAVGTSTSGEEAHLMWRCSGPRLAVVLHAPELAERAGPIPVRWRFDQGSASDRRPWRVSSVEAMAYASETEIYPFSELAASSSAVLMRTEDDSGRRYDYRFNLRGLNAGLNRLACVSHLDVLGHRRLAALFARARLPAAGAAEEGALERLVEEFPFVGHRTQRRYSPSDESCWRALWAVEEINFFRTETEARASGYARGGSCAF